MSSIADGLSVGGVEATKQEGVITTTADFMASLADDLALEDPEAAALAAEQAAAAAAASGESGAPVVVPPAGGQTPPVTPDSSTTPTGDEDENLTPEQKELKELKLLYGRQTAEVGELRKRVAEQDAAPVGEQAPAFVPGPITPELTEAIELAVEETGGREMAVWALTNRPDLYDQVLDAWSEQSGKGAREAAEFNIRYQTALQDGQTQAEQEAQAEFQRGLAATLDEEAAVLAPEYGLTPGTPETDTLLAETITEVGPSIQRLVVSENPKEREDGLRLVLTLAQSKATTTPPPATKTPEQVAAEAAALEHAKRGAGLGLGGLRLAPPAGEGGGDVTDFATAFQEALLNTPSTSVSDGLTFGKS